MMIQVKIKVRYSQKALDVCAMTFSVRVSGLTLSSDDPLVDSVPKADERKTGASYTLPSQRVLNTNDSSAKQGKVFSES